MKLNDIQHSKSDQIEKKKENNCETFSPFPCICNQFFSKQQQNEIRTSRHNDQRDCKQK